MEFQAPLPAYTLKLSRDVTMEFQWIPPGRFRMGSRGYFPDEEPIHEVLITRGFFHGRYPVTQEQFAVWRPEHKNQFDGCPRHPADFVSWNDSVGYCEWLNQHSADQIPKGYQAALPTEAEWEYACRAGTETEYYTGDGKEALRQAGWFEGNSDDETHPVGRLQSNAWGLFDMHGNVWEWCWDAHCDDAYKDRVDGAADPVVDTDADFRVFRGGCRGHESRYGWAANRGCETKGRAIWYLGFRAALRSVPGIGGGRASKSNERRRGKAATSQARRKEPTNSAALEILHLPFSDNPSFPWKAIRAAKQIVIGRLPKDKASPISVTLPKNFAKLFPNLTHLYLWQHNLEQLPELPEGLQCLDVRFCNRLTSLPKLPDTLTVLDLEGCAALRNLPEPPAGLERLYLDHCSQLDADELTTFWKLLQRRATTPRLLEFHASRCPAVRSLNSVPHSVRKLVLAGCENLADVAALAEFAALRHLNLSGCPRLMQIPDLPEKPPGTESTHPVGLQYVQLYGSDNLTFFMGQNIGPYDRGSKERPNVAAALYSRKKFGEQLSSAAHAKLLLLGDGRVGKTTLAKRLQWDCLNTAEQADSKNEHLRPHNQEQFTHKVQFRLWNTRLALGREHAEQLNARAEAAGLQVPCEREGTLPGTIRIWDFGGQEVYHQTHRIFAAEGSVFLLVWSDKEPDLQALDAECPEGITLPEWREWNRRHSLDYWLDYIDSIRPDAKMALVCTNVSQAAKQHPSFAPLAPRHAGRTIPCYYIDSLEANCRDNPEYQKLVRFIRESCGAEADRIGIIQPRFYSEVTHYVDDLLKENDRARSDDAVSPYLMISFDEWSKRIQEIHHRLGDHAPSLDDSDIGALTGYLHDAGNLFWLQSPDRPAIIIDQVWATDLIYELLHAGPTARSPFYRIRKNHGRFHLGDLAISDSWKRIRSEAEQQQIVSLMEQCNIIACIDSGDKSNGEPSHYLATQKWLLPEYSPEDDASYRRSIVQFTQSSGDGVAQWISSAECQLSEVEFRNLTANLARVLGKHGRWFRRHILADLQTKSSIWCLRACWQTDDVGYYGSLEVRLTTALSDGGDLNEAIEELLSGTNERATHGQTLRISFGRRASGLDSEFSPNTVTAPKAHRDQARSLVEATLGVLAKFGVRLKKSTDPVVPPGESSRLRNPEQAASAGATSAAVSHPQSTADQAADGIQADSFRPSGDDAGQAAAPPAGGQSLLSGTHLVQESHSSPTSPTVPPIHEQRAVTESQFVFCQVSAERWEFAFPGEPRRSIDTPLIGFAMYAKLLDKPNTQFSCLVLSGAGDMTDVSLAFAENTENDPRERSELADKFLELLQNQSADDVLDEQARREIRKRIATLKKAERLSGDQAQELEFLLSEYRNAQGLGYRPKKLDAGAGRIRKTKDQAVRNALRNACDLLREKKFVELAKHLKECCRQQKFSVAYYPPNPAPSWEIRLISQVRP